MFAVASAAWRNFSAHIGARTATTAVAALFAAVSLAVLPNVHPPQPKPMTTVARKPANAPCKRRVSDFFMNKFRKLGFIEYNGKLEVHNSLLNVVLHDKPEIKTRDEAISAE
jgi:hypothetical protein